jgi:hypothetical protein
MGRPLGVRIFHVSHGRGGSRRLLGWTIGNGRKMRFLSFIGKRRIKIRLDAKARLENI